MMDFHSAYRGGKQDTLSALKLFIVEKQSYGDELEIDTFLDQFKQYLSKKGL